MVFANNARSPVRLVMARQVDVLPVLITFSFTKVNVWTTVLQNMSRTIELLINAYSLVSFALLAFTLMLLGKGAFLMTFSVLKALRLMQLRLLVFLLQAHQYLSHSSS